MKDFQWSKEWQDEIDINILSVANSLKEELHRLDKGSNFNSYKYIVEFIDVGEHGLAYELLTHYILNEKLHITKDDFKSLQRVYDLMGKPKEFIDTVKFEHLTN